ncbi:E3 ubiquitin-protein ligase MARCHF5-like isoform X2 [Oppia nitens]|uniref:E3 ubiquitin-protein ligase MARCHF5-like isoform X2 n=1 Tax=Oppia nitens TaxID=1686743 RepID=UPI0023DB461D|nr:E3 ubiquitin-protein ligase MARCHF5-like isoform X2 [Oppia nitens]
MKTNSYQTYQAIVMMSIHHCWICLSNQLEDQDSNEWVRPCRCRETAQWVHQQCLQQWIDEKQRLNSSAKVMCCQCNCEYIIVFPTTGRFLHTIEWCDRLIYTGSPFLTVTCIMGSIYWTAVSYGAITVMQVIGQEEGKSLMESSDPLMLLVGLPSIPVMLILSKFIRWENQVLKLWRKNHHKIPFLDNLIGNPPKKSRESAERNLYSGNNISDPIAICRLFCGALLLPTCASLVGRYLFDRLASNLHKTILGGIVFTLTKGWLKILLRQQQFIKQTNRRVLNYKEDKTQQTTLIHQ